MQSIPKWKSIIILYETNNADCNLIELKLMISNLEFDREKTNGGGSYTISVILLEKNLWKRFEWQNHHQ